MMYIMYRDMDNPKRGPLERSWHVGEAIPLLASNYVVTELQADTEELECVKGIFPLFIAKGKYVAKITGEFAQLVFANL